LFSAKILTLPSISFGFTVFSLEFGWVSSVGSSASYSYFMGIIPSTLSLSSQNLGKNILMISSSLESKTSSFYFLAMNTK